MKYRTKEQRTIKSTVYRLPVPFRIALLSDLHNHPFREIQIILEKARPDLICIAGDLHYHGLADEEHSLVETQKNVLPFLRMCSSIAPSFLSLGNHELTLREEDLALISDTGVIALDNSWASFRESVIGGLNSHYVQEYRRFRQGKPERYPLRHGEPRLIREPDVTWLDENCAQPGYKILLSHHPEYYPRYLRARGIDLILSGHAHGGQWRIGNQGLLAPGQGLFPKYTSGVYENRLVVSRGLSNTAPVPRIHNPPEVVILEPDHR